AARRSHGGTWNGQTAERHLANVVARWLPGVPTQFHECRPEHEQPDYDAAALTGSSHCEPTGSRLHEWLANSPTAVLVVFTIPIVPQADGLVLGWVLHVIDHQHIDGPTLRVQLEPELLLHGRENRRAVRIDRRQLDPRRWFAATLWELIG